MNCKNCGEWLEGDGYTGVLHCPNTDEDVSYLEPDANPVYCNFDDEAEITEDTKNPQE